MVASACRLELLLERNVRPDAVDIRVGALQSLDRFGERRLLDVAEHHLDAGLREGRGDPEANPRRRAGDECGLSRQIFHAHSSFSESISKERISIKSNHDRHCERMRSNPGATAAALRSPRLLRRRSPSKDGRLSTPYGSSQ